MEPNPRAEIWNHFTKILNEGVAECNLCKHRIKYNRIYNLKLHLKKSHGHTFEINEYYHVNLLDNFAVCKTCNKCLVNRLSKLQAHMRKMHNVEMRLPEGVDLEPNYEDKIKAILQVAKRKMIEDANNEKRPIRRMYIKMDKYTIIRSVIGLIVEDGVSPNLFRSKHIEAILRPMCEAISDKEGKEFKLDAIEIERIISLITNYICNDFSNDLHCRLLSIRIDADLNAPPDTFCISAHFISNSKIQKLVLGVIKLDDDCQLKEGHIKQILYKYNIDSNQILSAFWDNTKHKYNKQVKNSEYLKEMDLFESYPDIFLGGVKLEPYLGTIAQLCLLDILKNSNIFQKFLECRNMTKFISDESNGYYELFESNNLTIPQLDSPWKAGSTYKMMNDLHAARNFLKDVKFEEFEHPEDHFNCNDELWSFVETFCTSTSYLQRSIMRYYSEELHIGDFYAQWLKCKLLTEKLVSATNKTNDLARMMSTQVLTAIENRTQCLLDQDRIVASLYLDPRFQCALYSCQKSRAVEYLNNLWCRAKLYIADEPESNQNPAQLMDDEEDAFLNEFLSHDKQTEDRGNSDILNKIKSLTLKFQMVNTDILSFWRGFKTSDREMHLLSTICFAIPATQIYSKSNYYDVHCLEAHSELSEYTNKNLINIRVNAHLLGDALAQLQLTGDDQWNSTFLSDTEAECYNISEDENSSATSTLTLHIANPVPSTTAKVQSSSAEVSSDELPFEEFI